MSAFIPMESMEMCRPQGGRRGRSHRSGQVRSGSLRDFANRVDQLAGGRRRFARRSRCQTDCALRVGQRNIQNHQLPGLKFVIDLLR